MTKFKATGLLLPLIMTAVVSGASGPKAQTACIPYSVNVPILQVLKDPNSPGEYVSVLQQGDIACISNDPKVGPQQLGFVVEKTESGGATVAVGGWASVIFMTEISAVAVPEQMTGSAAIQSAAPENSTVDAVVAEEDILRFDQPVPYGAAQVRGKSLKELAEGEPMFPPIEGLPENLWKKKCSSCHEWNAQRLCEQGSSYIARAAEVFRHQHPYGGAYKLSLMRWAKTGCN